MFNAQAEKEKYLKKLNALNYSEETIRRFAGILKYFFEYLNEKNIDDIREFGINEAEDYIIYLQDLKSRKKNGKKITVNYAVARISAVSRFFEYLEDEQKILANPFENIKRPKKTKTMPKDILTLSEIERLIFMFKDEFGVKWECLIEVMYGSGLRLTELLSLKLGDIDLKARIIHVRLGKGKKDRVIPIPQRTACVLKNYIKTRKEKITVLFNVSKDAVRRRFYKIRKKMNIAKDASPHSIRHAYATHLLEAGVDIRIIQMLLGHNYVSTTEIYTKVSVKELRNVYLKTHPRA